MLQYYTPTDAQLAVWFGQLLDPSSSKHNIGEYIEILGSIDQEQFLSATHITLKNSRTLNLKFFETPDGLRQLLSDNSPPELVLVDFTAHHRSADAARQWMEADMQRAVPITGSDPLYKLALLKIAEDRFYFYHRYHHIIFDGASTALIFRRIESVYCALSESKEPQLSSESWIDVIEAENKYKRSDRFLKDKAFWARNLHGAVQSPSLSGRQTPALGSQRSIRATERISATTLDGLKRLASACGVSLPQILTAVSSSYFHRLTGEFDFVVGMASRGGPPGVNRTILGMMSDILPLRLKVDHLDTVESFLRNVAQAIRTIFRSQAYRSERIRRDLHLPPNSNASLHSMVVNVFSFEYALEFSGHPTTINNLSIGPVDDCHVSFYLGQTQSDLRIDLDGNAALYDADCLARHLERLLGLLSAFSVASPASPIGDLPIVGETERHLLLHEWNATARDYPREACVHHLFEAQARRTPDAPALVFQDQTLTYAQLDARANQLAHHLVAKGVGRDTLVGLCLERSPELIVAMLGVLKAGGAYVPLDPAYPAQRLIDVIADSGAIIVLAPAAFVLPANDGVSRFDPQAAWVTEATDVSSLCVETPSDSAMAAYVMYTSGSTGMPKGVIVPHRAISRLVIENGYLSLNGQDRVAFAANPAFDAATFEVWGPLLNGGTCVIIDRDTLLDPASLADALHRQQVTVLWMTAGLFNQYADHVASCFPRLRCLLVGGDRLDPATIAQVLQHNRPERLLNGYGPTETTTFATTYEIDDVPVGSAGIPIGRPIANTRVYLLDAYGQLVPAGVAGEIHIGGDGVARGYLNRPELTASRFLPDPFVDGAGDGGAGDGGARMYRTGDLGRYLPDGTIEFLGRNDDQVKIRGFRVEPGEIEAVLMRHAGVRETVVLARPAPSGDKRLLAYVVPAAAKDAADDVELAAELRRHLRASLPDHMIPAAFVVLDALPLTPNGKIDRKALPEPDAPDLHEHAAPQGLVEMRIAAIWAELLGREHVGRDDNFFELGGHSLLAVSVIERLRREGWRVEVRALFLEPTLADLAAVIEAGSDAGRAADSAGSASIVTIPANAIPQGCAAITPVMLPLVALDQAQIDRIAAATPGGMANIQDIYPLSPLQEGILFHHLLVTDGDPYLLRGLVAFDTRERIDAYAQAMQAVVDRHDILRTAVLWEGLDEPVQVVWRHARVLVEQVCVEQVVPATQDGCDVAQQLSRRFDQAHTRLDVSQAPLIRLYYAYDRPNQRWLALQLFHHLVMDHTTLEGLQREIAAHLCDQAPLLASPVPFRNFIAEARLSVPAAEHDAYFTRLLGDIDEPTTPFGLDTIMGDGTGIAEAETVLGPDLSRRLRERARALGVTPASVCHLAFAQVLARVSAREDVVFGTVLFGRMQGGQGIDETLGLFINTLPVRIAVADDAVVDAVRHIHGQLARLLRHEHASLVRAQRCSGVAAPAPLFTALLNYRHFAPEPALDPTASTARDPWAGITFLAGQERTNYPFVLSVNDRAEGFSLTAQVQDHDPARVCAYMHRALTLLVEALEQTPRAPLASLDTMPPTERHLLLHEWNATARDYSRDYPREACVHHLFEAQVPRTPDAPALVFQDQTLTYAQLDARANQLAHHLVAKGVGRDTLVGLCLERSPELIVAMLGVLKAGGAYVPLDPAYPAQRLAFILADTRAPVLVTRHTLLDRLPAFGNIVSLDTDAQAITAWPTTAPRTDAGTDASTGAAPQTLAYVIYTSGSTGRPKGVPIEHSNLLNLVFWHHEAYAVSSHDRATQIAGPAFDASVWEIWPYLTAGASLHIAATAARQDPDLLIAWLAEQQITLTFLPTPLAEAVLAREWPDTCSLRVMLTGGDRLTRRPAPATPFRLVNHYGPTENTVVSSCAQVQCEDEASHAPAIGKPLPNTRIYLLDVRSRPVPVGVAGEIVVAGAQIARGYLNRPELTASRFLPDPFVGAAGDGEGGDGGAGDGGARMYRTGDLGRYLPDGTIEFLGRNDDQVKIRGFRVEPGEIEAVLMRHAGVRETVVLARPAPSGDKRLLAYVVPAGGKEAADEGELAAELRRHLRASLPDHMIPAAFVVLDALPLTPNGKIDRKALPEPTNSGANEVQFEPGTPTEEIIAAIWGELLDMEQVTRDDNFFDLGGHSLLALKLTSLLQERANIHLPVRLIFEAPTLGELVTRLALHNDVDRVDTIDIGSHHVQSNALQHDDDLTFSIAEKQQAYVRHWEGHRASPDSLIVSLNAGLPLPQLFWCLQGYNELEQLAVHLGIPVHGMRSGHLIMEYSEQNVRAIAKLYVSEMISIQPQGSFLLGGNCQGGVIAQEIAFQLQHLGHEVATLFLMEQSEFLRYNGHVALIFGRDSLINPYVDGANPDLIFQETYQTGYSVNIISGTHGEFFNSDNIKSLTDAISNHIEMPSSRVA